jgi:hypothetical protein
LLQPKVMQKAMELYNDATTDQDVGNKSAQWRSWDLMIWSINKISFTCYVYAYVFLGICSSIYLAVRGKYLVIPTTRWYHGTIH